jgi:hypothetical protein
MPDVLAPEKLIFDENTWDARRYARYDAETDTFFLDLGDPRPTFTRPGRLSGTYIHYIPKTDAPVGITVVGFWQGFARDYPKEAQVLMSAAPQVEVGFPTEFETFSSTFAELGSEPYRFG